MRFTVDQIIGATEGRQVLPAAPGAMATGLSWDSRTVASGDVYVALAGERVDGHAFVEQAARAGAACALVTQDLGQDVLDAVQARGCAVVKVADAYAALERLAGAWRNRLRGTVVGVTGSTGKTTMKNLIRDVLAAGGSVTATQGNRNNELGVPATVLSARADDDAVVVEMGMRGLGQIEQLCSFVRPDWGIVVNVGTSHMELLGSRDNIARAKGELLDALPAGGWAFLNGDDGYAAWQRQHARLDERGVRVAVFDGNAEHARAMAQAAAGVSGEGPARPGDLLVWAEDVDLDERGCASFTLCCWVPPACRPAEPADVANGMGDASSLVCTQPASAGAVEPGSDSAELQKRDIWCDPWSHSQRVACSLKLSGLHNVGNACGAAAVGLASGMALDEVARVLQEARPEAGRAQVVRAKNGAAVIDDSYNANPDSMRASLRAFSAFKSSGRKIAVLGDMGELGSYSDEGHDRVGADAARAQVDMLVCVGPLARRIADSACKMGLSSDRVVCVDNADAALESIRPLVQPEDAVLVKASHSVGLDNVVKGLVG